MARDAGIIRGSGFATGALAILTAPITSLVFTETAVRFGGWTPASVLPMSG